MTLPNRPASLFFALVRACSRAIAPVAALALLGTAAWAQAPTPAATKPASTSLTTPELSSALDADLFYQLLLGEVSMRNGDPSLGIGLMLEAARKTNDADLYNRAVEMAFQARSGDAALQAARAWRQAQPKSVLANEREFQILLALNRVPESAPPLRAMLANIPAAQRGPVIARSAAAYSRVSDKKLAASTIEQALSIYTSADTDPATSAQAWTAIGRLRFAAADISGAVDAAQKAQTASTTSDAPAVLALELMDPKQPQAEAILKRYLDSPKPRTDIRLGYARVLLDAQRYNEASQQIQVITREQPELPEAWLLQGTLQLQDNQLVPADTSLKRYVELVQNQPNTSGEAADGNDRQRGLTQAYLALAQVAEKRKDFALAESWIAKIDSPAALVSTQSRRASILAKQGKLDEARQLIRSLPERSDEDKRMKLLTEVQLLRDGQKYQIANDLLAQALLASPQDHELLYQQSNMAEKLGKFAEMERLLRQAIAAKPDYAEAYNALGYSLADRNLRLPEAKTLIQKALELTPGDPFITDSLGWVEFRMGNKAEAIKILLTAYQGKPDAEIAAHLGEVYWASGQRDKATAIWKEGMLLNAENETLLSTLKRLRVKL
jgi:tetratricopeptide (TPR) repeat protein